jgi:hypothetical protein
MKLGIFTFVLLMCLSTLLILLYNLRELMLCSISEKGKA